MIGRPKVPLVLTTPEQQACARGLDNQTVAKKLRVSPQMVGRWRARFVTRRVDGLLDEPRPGAPRTITDDTVEAVIVRTLETTPDGATHWSTRTLAKATGLSHGTIARIWRAVACSRIARSHAVDPLLIEKVRDVVGLYLHPPHALVLCVEKNRRFRLSTAQLTDYNRARSRSPHRCVQFLDSRSGPALPSPASTRSGV